MRLIFVVAWAGVIGFASEGVVAAEGSSDWPMWRYDAKRSAETAHSLPAELHLQWVRRLGKPAPAWPDEQYKLQFDRSYEPVVMGGQIFVGSMVADRMTAYDTRTGREQWRFYCDGPVRFAPVAWKGKLYFISDDGCLYCLNAADGKLIRKLRLGPSQRKILGNHRIISMWPARGGPVLFDGKIYCAASIWPFMGVFIYSIDAETGRIVWENSAAGSTYMAQQHGSDAFGGVAPQGYLAATEKRLLIPSRTTPACYDRQTGKLIYYRLSNRGFGKNVGGYDVSIREDLFFNHGIMYRLRDGEGLVRTAVQVPAADAIIAFAKDGDLVGYVPQKVTDPNRKKNDPPIKAVAKWQAAPDSGIDRIHIKAGSRLYGSNGRGTIAAIDIPEKNAKADISWSYRIKGKTWNMLAGDARLFVVTEDGLLYCFGGEKAQSKWLGPEQHPTIKASRKHRRMARRIFARAGTKQGYCVLLGAGDGELLKAILAESQFHIIAADPDPRTVERLRREMDDAGLYGRRLSIFAGDIGSVELPPYLANLIIAQNVDAAKLDASKTFVEKIFHSLRPYGGTAWLGVRKKQRPALVKRISNCNLPASKVNTAGQAVLLRRTGPLPGSGDWVGPYADPANTVCSKDELKAPLGLLWFADDSNFTDVLPRHSHGPSEQVVAGRLFIEGIDSISARDVYTGRTFWKTVLKDPGTFGIYYDKSYDSNYRDPSSSQGHIPGANSRGTNFAATEDKVYVIDQSKCRVLDAATGKDISVFSLPARDGEPPVNWAYIAVYGEYLIAGADFVKYLDLLGENNKKLERSATFFDKYASKRLVAMNRHTGEVLWTVDANVGFIHNGIAAGDGRIFCLDALPPYIKKIMTERKIKIESSGRLLALDVRDGSISWENTQDVFGSWLGYSEQHDVLLQAHRKSRDMVWEPGNRMATYTGKTGDELWDKAGNYGGPCIILDDKIITQEKAYNLLTGEQIMRKHPLTGESVAWGFSRNHGCSSAVASKNLLTFRSAAAGYFDLADDGGTGNFGGFKSGCSTNLIVANGVLNAPDYTRTCTCSYQNQSSLAMVHMPEVETWTFNPLKAGSERIRRLGINFGAPGDRKADNGTLWLDYPSVGGSSPPVSVTIEPKQPEWFRRHSSLIKKGPLKWVQASGAKGITAVTIKVAPSSKAEKDESPYVLTEQRYTVRLYFAEPDAKSQTRRLFDVAIEGKTVLENFDIAKEAGSPNVGIVKEFPAVSLRDSLTISLTPKSKDSKTIICGIELIAE